MILLLSALVILYSIILHEIAHAKAAEIMGDPTARLAGRITLNPMPHLDLYGTILPILLIFSGSPIVFGWAKPVPINQYNFRDQQKGMLFVSLAGIVTNIFIAWVAAVIFRFVPIDLDLVRQLLFTVIQINVVLAIFNLIPIPPLDGSRLFLSFLPYQYQEYLYRIEPYGFVVLIFLIWFPPTAMLINFIISFVINLLLAGI